MTNSTSPQALLLSAASNVAPPPLSAEADVGAIFAVCRQAAAEARAAYSALRPERDAADSPDPATGDDRLRPTAGGSALPRAARRHLREGPGKGPAWNMAASNHGGIP
jgi:hypothetical protein